jgi:exportin-2 (importin alpha re-exporter)
VPRRFVVAGDPKTLADFETSLFPPFTYILQQDVVEFSPFVFQILSQLLEAHGTTQGLPEAYQGLIGPLLNAALWTNAGNVPALIRLLRAVLARGSDMLVESNQLSKVKDIARFLIESTGKKHDAVSMDLVEAVWEYVPACVASLSPEQTDSRADRRSIPSPTTSSSFCSPASCRRKRTRSCRA